MPHPLPCHAADFFVLRTPSLPLEALSPRSQEGWEANPQPAPGPRAESGLTGLDQVLRGLVQRGIVREAVALASPDLASRLDAWLEGTLQGKAARNMEHSLMKYLSRMSSRSTPFGLFAGVSTGTWNHASHLSVGCWPECRKSVRLDWSVLEILVDRLEREAEVRSFLDYRPNTSLYAQGGWYRYLERRDQAGQGRSYHLEAVEATPHLDLALQQAQEGACLEDLTACLARRMEVEPTAAQVFLNQLIDAQVLCGGLCPPLTDPDPLGRVIQILQSHPATAPMTGPLFAVVSQLDAIQRSPLGSKPGGYHGLSASLADLGIPTETRDVLQVDLFRPSPGLALSPKVRQALEEGADRLRRLTQPPDETPLDRFRAAFEARYGSRWMPLLEVLDEESGIGFDGAPPQDSPLLMDLPIQRPAPPRPLSRRDLFLMAQIPRWQGATAWELEDADLEALTNPEPQPFPASFAALASLAASSPSALDRGEFQFWMEAYSGPTAARWLGRFASGDPELKGRLQSHLQKEEALRPEAVFAEVLHVPEGRTGNVLARPSLRGYEIPFLATPGVPGDKAIRPSDLRVTVRGNHVFLASARLGREVIPRLSSAHNFNRGPVLYRFLANLQDQDGRPGGWSWGALAELPFLPRVTCGRQVLCKARWRIESRELKEAQADSREGAWDAFQRLRKTRKLPRLVLLTDADNSLLVDLDQVLWVETLHHLVSSRSTFTLTECFPDPGQALVASPEGRFAHELVIPFEADPSSPSKPAPLRQICMGIEPRVHPPGSEWLYLKLYCGSASADQLLSGLEPLLRMTKAEGLWDRWHFVRFRDPAPHLRLRFHGLPIRLLAELLPRLHQHLEQHLAHGSLWKVQVDTFEPELERYGGPLAFALAEEWFFEDSQQILDRLSGGMTLEQRWRAGLRDTDAIWAALGLSLPSRQELAQAARDGFRKEFGDPGEGAAQIGKRFREFRKELEAGFPIAVESPLAPGLCGLARIREAFERGQMQEEVASLAGSLAHMHLNRLLRTDHRENEWVIMEFLVRLYESCRARSPKEA
ncbi:MAG: lantibiotic dehydratase [Holophagaceae bacterium]|nr:lantibiotic dehydratase [Holophagaceae bacterium]